ncbi:MAG: hypothetical protein Q4D16_10715 [Eubacteriales bacterium]|nr:hypothetical protein [Eubacteriales bacterium]
MANICCDDVQFLPGTNPKGIDQLWEDLEASIVLCPDSDYVALSRLFQYKNIPVTGIYLRGVVAYMERNADGVLLDLETAWEPLYEAYGAIADAYGVTFVLKSVEPGEKLFINTDSSGSCFPERYIVCIYDEEMSAPSGTRVTEVIEDWEVYTSEAELLETFRKLGYIADTAEELNGMLDEDEIHIYEFENFYANKNTAA